MGPAWRCSETFEHPSIPICLTLSRIAGNSTPLSSQTKSSVRHLFQGENLSLNRFLFFFLLSWPILSA